MNIALTYRCNQRCAYCFGMDAMHLKNRSGSPLEMTFTDLDKVLAFLRGSRESVFRMIGGEPTQHRRFTSLFEHVARSGFKVMMFTNGVIDARITDFLRRQDCLVNALINIREPREYSRDDWKRILNTLGALKGKATLSFRIYRMDFKPDFLFDLIDRFGLDRSINWAISCPSLYRKNVFIPLKDHREAVSKMALYLRESHSRGITWYSDSGFIRCAFTDKQVERFKKLVSFVPVTNCTAALEVAPDLRVFRCFGMAAKSRPNLRLTDFKTHDQMHRFFQVRSLSLKRVGGLDKCLKCEHMLSGVCSGGCMVHIVRSLPGYASLPPLF